MDKTLAAFEEALLTMDRQLARRLFFEAHLQVEPLASIDKYVIAALDDIGRGWESGDLALSQVYMSGRICEELIEEALPCNAPTLRASPIIGIAAFEDHHMLGKRIVQSMLRSAGYRLIDYGRLDAESAVRHAEMDELEFLCLSVLMLNSALHLAPLKRELEKLGTGVRMIAGGAPFRLDENLGKEVGADAVGRTASDAIDIIRSFTRGAACQA